MNTGSPNPAPAEASLQESAEQPAATSSAPPSETARSEAAADQNPSIHPWRNVWVAAIVVVVVGVLAALGIMATLPRLANDRALNAAAADVSTARPRVTVAQAHKGAPTSDRVLPGNALPLDDAMIFARTTGYLDQRLVDIGDRVKVGQLLAVISAPQIDDQLRQNEANLVQAKANLDFAQASWDLAKAILARESKAAAGGAITQEQLDQDRASVETTAAQVEVARASIQVNTALVQQFTDLQKFEKVVAPFDGVITARHVDVGDLMTADSPGSTRQMFEVQRTDTLRVHVNVPQIFATLIKVGEKAIVTRREAPDQKYTGTVTRTANALDPATRTLLTEVQVANPKDDLRPGMFLQVEFIFQRPDLGVMVPSAAILVRDNASQVAVLDDQQRVSYQKVELGRDFGAEIEVLTGLHDGQTVLVYPGDQLPVGTVVEPVPLPKN
jgi:RND family efflux transporter MFP subunit